MQYALIVFEIPFYGPKEIPMPDSAPESTTKREWEALSKRLREKAKGAAGVQTLAENVYQIPLDGGLQFLAECIQGAAEKKVPYRVRFLEEEPQWFGTGAQITPSPE
jgi:hypothetical protein